MANMSYSKLKSNLDEIFDSNLSADALVAFKASSCDDLKAYGRDKFNLRLKSDACRSDIIDAIHGASRDGFTLLGCAECNRRRTLAVKIAGEVATMEEKLKNLKLHTTALRAEGADIAGA